MTRLLTFVTLAMTLILSGCALEASHELLPTSPLPRGIAHDPRMRGLGPVRVTTDSFTDGTIVATVTSLERRGRFKVRGTIAALDPPEKHSNFWRETYNGETDVLAYALPDYHFVRVVPHPSPLPAAFGDLRSVTPEQAAWSRQRSDWKPAMNAKEGKENPAVDAYLSRAKKWQEELKKLRTILLECPLTEELKYGKPCYTFQKRNVVIIVPFKESCALLFSKGALLKDANRLLIQPTENTQSARQMRFTSVREIVEMETVVKSYVNEAVEVEKAGLEVVYKQTSEFKVAAEFQSRLDKSAALRHAFDALTPGRQRGYLLHFSAPKQSKTRESRVEKWLPQILGGKGLND